MYTFYCYPNCSTCKKAQKHLDEMGIDYKFLDITKDTPSAEQLKEWHEKSGLSLRRWFNTSGMKYRELDLAKKLDDMKGMEPYEVLASDGMLIRRPVLIGDDGTIQVGYKKEAYDALKS